jgi:ribosomal protein L11 methylase PrmA
LPEIIHRRVAGYHDVRLDGISDLVLRAPGASVLDIGCNRGLVGFEFANNGATKVHGVDIDPDCINVARHVFADLRSVQSQFEVVDLTEGPSSLAVLSGFGSEPYDIVVMLATYHKIKRKMPSESLSKLMKAVGKQTKRYFGWRGTTEKHEENDAEIEALDRDLGPCGLVRIHTSRLSKALGVACIWERR